MKSVILFSVATVFIMSAIFIIPPCASAQDTSKTVKKEKIKIRIEKDENGKKTVIDTVIDASDPAAMARMEEMLAEKNIKMKLNDEKIRRIEKEIRRADDQVREAEKQIRRMEVQITALDSGMNDSATRMVKKFYIDNDGDGSYFYSHHPGDFEFNFEVPEIPEIYEIPDVPPVPHMRGFHGRGQTLSDVIGDIPMSNVRSYSIKETKNGKKITIELDDDAVIEKSDRIIILNRHGRPDRPPRPPREHMD